MKKTILTISTLMIAGLISSGALATVPDVIPVQGVLADSAGTAIDADTDITFTLYDSDTATTSLWTETVADVDVDLGFFTVYLGENSSNPLEFDTMLTNAEIWLGITVESDPEMDRILLASVPFAQEALVCQSVGTLTESDINSNFLSSTSPAAGVTSSQVSNWDTAYGWGDHSGLYAPASHTHAWSTITGMPSGFADGVDNDTNTTYGAGDGLDLSGTTFSVDPTDFNGTTPISDGGEAAVTATTTTTLDSVSFTAPANGHLLMIGKAYAYCATGCSSSVTGAANLTIGTSTSAAVFARHDFNVQDKDASLFTFDTRTVMSGTTYTIYLRGGGSTSTNIRYNEASVAYVFMPD